MDEIKYHHITISVLQVLKYVIESGRCACVLTFHKLIVVGFRKNIVLLNVYYRSKI